MVEVMVENPGGGTGGGTAGLDLGVVAAAVGSVCVDGVDLGGVDVLVVACQRLRSAVAALESRLVRRHEELMNAAGCRPDAASHLAATLGVPPREAKTAVRVAETLAVAPGVEAALVADETTAGHAEVLSRVPVEHRVAAGSDPGLMQAARSECVDGFRRCVNDFVAARDGDVAGVDKARRQHQRRRAAVFTTGDDMVRVDALLAPDTGAVVTGAIDAISDELWRNNPDNTTAAQRNADALVEMARRATTGNPATGDQATGGQAMRARCRPEVIAVIDVRWLTGQIDQAATTGRLPRCDIPGIGELTPAAARRLACDAAIIPMVLGGDSQPLDVGRKRYRTTPAQRRALIVRDGGCVWPGCDRPPGWCEAHHLDEWLRNDGPTDLDNLALLCPRHHHDAHEGGQLLERPEGDSRSWQVRLGLPPPRAP